jgi:hypothetical protein
MLLAASLLPAAQIAIDRFLATGRRELKERVEDFLGWLKGEGARASAAEAQRRFVFLRLRFNAVLSQLDLFSHVITQRSEAKTASGCPVSTSSPRTRWRCLGISKPRR